MTEESSFHQNNFFLLTRLEHILESDPLIDEVGFVHPSQFAALNDERGVHPSVPSVAQPVDELLKTDMVDANVFLDDSNIFWSRDHKLAISTHILFALYKAARQAFMTARKQHNILKELTRKKDKNSDGTMADGISVSEDFLESEVLKHSKALLLLSCDFGTAWNSRKLILSQKKRFSLLLNELLLSALTLSYSPKSEYAWSHRRWVIKTMEEINQDLQEVVEKESELVERIAEKSKMNYRAWNHRCWLVTYMTREQVLNGLRKSRKWAEMHVADSCCFHYRRRLLQRILASGCSKQASNVSCLAHYHAWKGYTFPGLQIITITTLNMLTSSREELDWNQMLIKRYVGREALWVHRRFLSQLGTKYYANENQGALCQPGDQINYKDKIFVMDELLLLRSCLKVSDNEFEDGQAQSVLAAAYILWLLKQIPSSQAMEIQELRDLDLKSLLNKFCPERARLWNGIMD